MPLTRLFQATVLNPSVFLKLKSRVVQSHECNGNLAKSRKHK